ncbi:hypothetical protein D9M71_261000 [compost metagenome]
MHLRGGALEQTAAAGGEQGVAAEQQRLAVILGEQGDMPGGVPGNVEYLPVEIENADPLAVLEGDIAPRNRLQRRAEHPCPAVLLEGEHAAGVVVVVVGDQAVGELPTGMRVQPGQYRSAVAGVDHRAVSARGILQQPDIIVGEGGQGGDLYHEQASRYAESIRHLRSPDVPGARREEA